MASDSTFASHQAGRITDEAARRIAEAAPNNEALQNVALDQIQNNGSSISDVVNTMLAVSTVAGNAPAQDDIFGMDTSAMESAIKMGREASKRQRDIQSDLSAITGASKNPARAKALGVDVKNPNAVKAKVDQLRREKERWDNWATDPELTKQLREAIEPPAQVAKTPPDKPTQEAKTEAPSNDGVFFGRTDAKQERFKQKLSTLPIGHLKHFGKRFLWQINGKTKEAIVNEIANSGYSLEQMSEALADELDSSSVINQRGKGDDVTAKFGWKVVGGGKNIPGYASEKAAQVAINKNNEWHGARIESFPYWDGAMNSKTATRYAVVVKTGEDKASAAIESISDAAKPTDFIKAPDGTNDFGEITPEIAKAIGRQAGKIRLLHGEHKGEHKGFGAEHIQQEHPEIGNAIDFVSRVAKDFDAIYRTRLGRLKVVKVGKPNELLVVELQPSGSNDFYSVISAYNSRKVSEDPLWSAAQSRSTESGSQSALSDMASQHKTSKTHTSDKQSADMGSITQKQDGTQTIDDFGEELKGAKKHLSHLFKDKISNDDITSKPLSQIWPVDTYLKTDNPVEAALAYVMRSYLPNKPRSAYRLATWVKGVERARDAVNMLGDLTVEQLRDKSNDRLYRGVKDALDFALLLQELPKEQWKRLTDAKQYPDAGRYTEDRTFIKHPFVELRIDKKLERFDGDSLINEDIARKIKEQLNIEAPQKGGLTARDFDIYTQYKDGTVFISRKADKEKRPLKAFSKEEGVKAAKAYLKENVDALAAEWEAVKARDNVSKRDVRNKENRERVGKDWRNGQDVTPEQFSEAFGFRGVQFGNWVSQGKGAKERQGMLNQAYDALMDLANILSIPPKAVSLNGSLGLAFGARGKGNSAAHYERDNLVINLTKTKGAGSLAHEWFHALDNYFSLQRGDNQKTRQDSYITYQPESYYIHKNGKTKIPERSFEDAIQGKPFNGGYRLSGARVRSDWTLVKGVRPEVEAAFAELAAALNKAPMRQRAEMIDSGKSDGYWSRIIERAARSFEDYTIMKLAEQGITNDYLANVTSFEDFKRAEERYPYNKPEEMQPIKEAFDNLFDTIETKEDDSGNVALFSRKAPPKAFAVDIQEAASFVEGVDRLVNSLVTNVQPIKVTDMPNVLRALGVRDVPIMLSRDVIRKAVNGVKHNVPMDAIKQLPYELNDPLAIFRSATHPNDAFVVITEMDDVNGNPVVVALDVRNVGKRFDVTRISSLYGKDGLEKIAKRWVDQGLLAYKSKRAVQSGALKGLQLPNRNHQNDDSGRILTEDDILSSVSNDALQSRSQQNAKKNLAVSDVKESLNQALGERLAEHIEVVQSQDQLPDGLVPIESNDVVEGAFDPNTNKIYLITANLATPERAAWVAFHELFHRGLRNSKALREYRTVLDRAKNNKMVERVAKAIAEEHGLTNFAEAVEEALAELNAADEFGLELLAAFC